MRESSDAWVQTPPAHLMDCFPAALLHLRDNGQIAHFNLAWAELMGAPGAGAGRGDVIGSDLEVVRADPNGLGLRGNPLTRRDSSRNHSGHR